jgi:TusA-related sulfurtransferase
MTKRALDQNGNRAMVLVDNQVAVDNITRFADSRGLKVLVKEKDGDFELTIG